MIRIAKTLLCMGIFSLSACGPDTENCEPRKQAVRCEERVTYWLDSCGNLGEIKEQCPCGCLVSPLSGCQFCCAPYTCEYIQRECGRWPDGCGDYIDCGGCGGYVDCGDCPDDSICNLHGQCICSS